MRQTRLWENEAQTRVWGDRDLKGWDQAWRSMWSFPKGGCRAGAQQRESSLSLHPSPHLASLFPSLSCPGRIISPAFQSSGLDPSPPSKPKVHQTVSTLVGFTTSSQVPSVWNVLSSPNSNLENSYSSFNSTLRHPPPGSYPWYLPAPPPTSANDSACMVHPWSSCSTMFSLSLSSSCILYFISAPLIWRPLEGFILICFYLYILP